VFARRLLRRVDAIREKSFAKISWSLRRKRGRTHRWGDLEPVVPDQQNDLDQFLCPVHCGLCIIRTRRLLLAGRSSRVERLEHSVCDVRRQSLIPLLLRELARLYAARSSFSRERKQTGFVQKPLRTSFQQSVFGLAQLGGELCVGLLLCGVGSLSKADSCEGVGGVGMS